MTSAAAGDEPPSTTGDGPPVTVTVADGRAAGDQAAIDGADLESWRNLAHAVLAEEGVGGKLGLTFIDEDDMAGLNLTHMGREGPTDVLSFPLDGRPEGAEAGDAEGANGVPRLLGDVVICPSVARANADQSGVSPADELGLLVVHGVLHVLGWDHATEDEQVAMQARERHHLDRWRATTHRPTGTGGP